MQKLTSMDFPHGKRKKLPVVVLNTWLKKNLDEHNVIVDVRNQVKQRLPGAVNFTVAKLQTMGKDFKSRKLKSLNKNLPGLGDKKAPIIVYADSTFSKEALRGYKELLSWGYKNVTILDGGLTEWKQKGFPLLNTPPESRLPERPHAFPQDFAVVRAPPYEVHRRGE